MKAPGLVLLILLPFLFAARTDVYQQVGSADRQPLKQGVERYTQDQIKRNWSDLFEIKIPGYAIDADYDALSGKTPVHSKKDFVDAMDERVSNGSLPFMQSFDLTSITPREGRLRGAWLRKGSARKLSLQGNRKVYALRFRWASSFWLLDVRLFHAALVFSDIRQRVAISGREGNPIAAPLPEAASFPARPPTAPSPSPTTWQECP